MRQPSQAEKDSLAQSAADFGILLETEEPEADDFELLPENEAAVSAFFALDGCAWQYAPMGGLIGLDYLAAKTIWEGLGITLDSTAFAGVMLFSKTLAELLRTD